VNCYCGHHTAIKKVGVSKGFCFVNSLPIGPAWLIPANENVWPKMYDTIIRDLAQMPQTADDISSDGFFGSLFAHAFVLAGGVSASPTFTSR
jgi:hypothetical protein